MRGIHHCQCGTPMLTKGRCKDCAPAQEEKEMETPDRCTKCPSVLMRHEEVMCSRCRDKEDARTADLRQLHREAALAALTGFCARPFWEAVEGGQRQQLNPHEEAIAVADSFIRQYNPDAVIAEVVG